MINKNILKAVLMAANKEAKDAVIKELLNHISLNYDYNDEKAGHIVACLMDTTEIVGVDKINQEWLEHNLDKLIYQANKYDFKNVRATNVDNIDCIVRIEFEYLERDKENSSYCSSYTNLSFIENPEILK